MSSRPSDLVLSAMNQKASSGRFFSGSELSTRSCNNNPAKCSDESNRPLSAESSDSFPEHAVDTSISSVTSLSSVSGPPALQLAANNGGSSSDASVGSSGSVSSVEGQDEKPQPFSPRPPYLNLQNSFVSYDSHPYERNINTRSMPVIPLGSQSTIPNSGVETIHVAASSATVAAGRRKQRLRKSLTKAEKEKLFDNDNGNDDISADSEMYNVPIASGSTAKLFKNSSARHSRTILRKAWPDAEEGMVLTPSPLPGTVLGNESSPSLLPSKRASTRSSYSVSSASGSISSHRTFVRSDADLTGAASPSTISSYNRLSPMAKQLTDFYEYSIRTNANKEMKRRSHLVECKLGNQQVQLEDKRLDDCKLMSPEKLEMLSLTRPVWLPPKDKSESIRQEHEFREMIRREGHRAKKESLNRESRQRSRMIGDARLLYLSGKESLSGRNVAEVKTLIWRSEVKPDVRVSLFAMILKHRFEIKTDEELNKLPSTAPDDIGGSSVDVNSLVDSLLHSCDDPKLLTSLSNLLKRTARMKSWTLKSYKVAFSLLNEGFSTPETLRTLHYLNDLVIDDTFVNKFDQNIKKNRVLLSAGKHFKDDLNAINMSSLTQLLNNLGPKIIFKVINLLIAYGDYKVLYAILLTVLLHYHFGWNNVQLLLNCNCKENLIKIEDEDLFWARVYGLYKKF
ncbi:DEKNAAC100868 [Brettanomyces naardenensis]|uniref:DEKNAAC100868 n=1 Tax=Brettanomyces naardenensis TaxID=13370 RepID=A0A448YGE1_BRENA|nr:DEKNAAC100868 [Brettanomyces naardenensis]